MEVIKGANWCYVVLNILLLVVLVLFLKKKQINKQVRLSILGVAIFISLVMFSYLNGIVSSIFQLKYLSVKTYLVVVIISNLIALWTINKKVGIVYKVLNYGLFMLMTVIFGSTAAVLLGNRFESFYVMDVGNAVNFIDLSMVVFMIYLIVLAIVYIGEYLFFSKKEIEEENEFLEKKERISSLKLKMPRVSLPKVSGFKRRTKKEKEKVETQPVGEYLTPEELLSYQRGEGFYIHGVECSIIFEDSNQGNIVKNYYILLEDIHARLVNGYTLEENMMLKSICQKLQVSNLGSVDINNVSLLNKISIDEYMLLRRVLGVN